MIGETRGYAIGIKTWHGPELPGEFGGVGNNICCRSAADLTHIKRCVGREETVIPRAIVAGFPGKTAKKTDQLGGGEYRVGAQMRGAGMPGQAGDAHPV